MAGIQKSKLDAPGLREKAHEAFSLEEPRLVVGILHNCLGRLIGSGMTSDTPLLWGGVVLFQIQLNDEKEIEFPRQRDSKLI